MLEICCLKNSIVKRNNWHCSFKTVFAETHSPSSGSSGIQGVCVLFRCSHLMGVKRETSMRAVQQQNVMLPKSLG